MTAVAYVAVVGPGDHATEPELSDARAVGRLLARRRAVVVCGGLGGVMAAAAQGAHQEGGVVVGLLPGTDRSEGNEHLSVAVATGLGELRNGVIVRSADAVVAVGGSWGTLSEVALAVRTGVPVVALRGWTVLDAEGRPLPLATARSPEEAVEAVLAMAAGGAGGAAGAAGDAGAAGAAGQGAAGAAGDAGQGAGEQSAGGAAGAVRQDAVEQGAGEPERPRAPGWA
ncbi:MAG TPA: TIGR00725 family protein [Acidimicrobiales bacterium]|nr:TIGR00725 family protein [Acidimicrobiales bacterium]